MGRQAPTRRYPEVPAPEVVGAGLWFPPSVSEQRKRAWDLSVGVVDVCLLSLLLRGSGKPVQYPGALESKLPVLGAPQCKSSLI